MAKPDLKQLSDHVYYLPGGVNAAIVTNSAGEAVLVDTGGDKEYGRNIRKACEALNVTPVAILNTHSHADHYGGNDYLLRQFELKVYAPAFEASILQSPYLEPVYLFSGAKPLPELMNKWLLAKPSKVDELLEPGMLELHGITLDILDTPGHAHQHVSILTDGVLIAADALFGASVLTKYPLPFGQDIGNQMKSAESLREIEAQVALPGHGDPTEAISELVQENSSVFNRAAEQVVAACDGASTEEVLRRVCESLDITLSDLPRFYLNHCVVSAYLSYLVDEGRIEVRLEDSRVTWHPV